MKNNKLEAEQKAQLELEMLEKDLTGLIRQRADQLANKNVELEQIKTQMVQTERMLMDERRESSKLRHQYDEEKERRMNLLKVMKAPVSPCKRYSPVCNCNKKR